MPVLEYINPTKEVDNIADFFIYYANEFGDLLTNLKIQKLVYYSQAWYLALYDKPLFSEDFEAWVHGPVLPTLYQRFKKFGYQPINEKIEKPNLLQEVEAHLKEIYHVFNKFNSYELELMTHREKPWQIARGNLPSLIPSSNKINKEEMRDFYKSVANEK
ncbi:MAG: DUF4065 domain-containing protein [Ignavibacterium sp.]|nr:DUF4065 domain-containing protein [Ignavibacterium sp.]